MTIAAAMRIGASLPDVERTTSWGAPTLKVRGTMIACQAINKQAEPGTLVVCMPVSDRDELIAAVDDHFSALTQVDKPVGDMVRDDVRWFFELIASQPSYAAIIQMSRRLVALEDDPGTRARRRFEGRVAELHRAKAAVFGLQRDDTATGTVLAGPVALVDLHAPSTVAVHHTRCLVGVQSDRGPHLFRMGRGDPGRPPGGRQVHSDLDERGDTDTLGRGDDLTDLRCLHVHVGVAVGHRDTEGLGHRRRHVGLYG